MARNVIQHTFCPHLVALHPNIFIQLINWTRGSLSWWKKTHYPTPPPPLPSRINWISCVRYPFLTFHHRFIPYQATNICSSLPPYSNISGVMDWYHRCMKSIWFKWLKIIIFMGLFVQSFFFSFVFSASMRERASKKVIHFKVRFRHYGIG